jgi:hypothetical protein
MSGFRHACLSFFRLHRDHPATKLTGAAAILTMALPMPWMLRSKRPQAGRQTKQERRACSHASGELSWVREDRRSPRFHALPLRSRITWCGKRMAQWATFLYVLSWKWCDHLRLGVGAGVHAHACITFRPQLLLFAKDFTWISFSVSGSYYVYSTVLQRRRKHIAYLISWWYIVLVIYAMDHGENVWFGQTSQGNVHGPSQQRANSGVIHSTTCSLFTLALWTSSQWAEKAFNQVQRHVIGLSLL